MRRILAATAALVIVPLAFASMAKAADTEYVQLNEKGLKQTLIKKSWAPGWLGTVDSYDSKVSSKGAKPYECYTKGSPVKGEKSSTSASMYMDLKQNKPGHIFQIGQYVYQYDSVQTAQFAWQDLIAKAGSCAGTHEHTLKDDTGTKIGTATVTIKVFTEPGMYGQEQLIINEDVQYVEPTPGAVPSRESADELSIWVYDGATIIEVEANKFVPKQKNWVFSEPQIATIETLALVAIQRYHLAALRAL